MYGLLRKWAYRNRLNFAKQYLQQLSFHSKDNLLYGCQMIIIASIKLSYFVGEMKCGHLPFK